MLINSDAVNDNTLKVKFTPDAIDGSTIAVKEKYHNFTVFEVELVHSEAIIPTEERVQNGQILYETNLTLTLTLPWVTNVQWRSNRAVDNFSQFDNSTDSNGVAKVTIQTRESGNAIITSIVFDNSFTDDLTFQEVDYESTFYATCYIVALETDYTGETIENPNGLHGIYIRSFLEAVRMQGSGRDRNDNLIQIDWSQGDPMASFETTYFTIVSQIITASGAPLTEDITIAVDPTIIPQGSSVNVENIGIRSADDTGGDIIDYHIDIFVGFGIGAAQGWQNIQRRVRFLSY